MSDRYYVLEPDGLRTGPYSVRELVEMAESGQLSRSSELTSEATGQKVSSNEIEGLAWPDYAPRKPIPVDHSRRNSRFLLVGVGLAVGAIGVPLFGVSILPEVMAGRATTGQDTAFSQYASAYHSMGLYLADYDDHFPPDMSSVEAIERQLRARQGQTADVVKKHENGIPVLTNPTLGGVSRTNVEQAERTLLYFDGADWKNKKRLVVSVDGNMAKISSSTLEKAVGNKYRLPIGAGQ